MFAARPYISGEIVEVCPVLVLRTPSWLLPKELKTYVFDWATLAQVPKTEALALGYGSMYNHDNPANMRYEADSQFSNLRFIAVRDINEGEELTINYNACGGGAEWNNDNWFDRKKITLITGK